MRTGEIGSGPISVISLWDCRGPARSQTQLSLSGDLPSAAARSVGKKRHLVLAYRHLTGDSQTWLFYPTPSTVVALPGYGSVSQLRISTPEICKSKTLLPLEEEFLAAAST
ncbi:hypothetical protein JZ751_014213 [Albula glossodonta]|uniref:Uncharacterized protein n=1 Tax=Albula glossodonta TaxID=121402 RepID=A0A8T2NSU8_9TELE|nr:hypothetical protein JZ751_014213 [Albula glossodonta]